VLFALACFGCLYAVAYGERNVMVEWRRGYFFYVWSDACRGGF